MLRLITIFCLADIAAIYLSGNTFFGSWWLSQFVNVVYFLIPVLLSYLWLIYIEVKLKLTNNLKKLILLTCLPAVISCALILINPFTSYFFSIDASNIYHRGPGILLHWAVSWLYFLWALGLVLIKRKKETNPFKRSEYANYLLFIVPIIITSLTQMFVYGVTSTQVGFVFATVLMLFASQQTLVQKDELTGLNNRYSFSSFKHQLFSSNKETEITIFVIDVDHFKNINDTFGHLIGDEALKHTANILMRAAGSIESPRFLIYRTGGDEFVIMGMNAPKEAENRLIDNLHNELKAENRIISNGYEISLSIGISKGKCSKIEDFNALIKSADEDMYLHKSEHYSRD